MTVQIVAVCGQKGGVGKTTLAQCLSIEALKEGRRAAIIDMDPQGSVARWGVRRAAAGISAPLVMALGSKSVQAVVSELSGRGATFVVIDTPPLVTPTLNAALQAATGAVLVTRPNPMDIEALEGTWAIVRRLAIRSAAVITQAPPSAQRARALALAKVRLDAVGIPTCPNALSYTLGYPYAQAEALTVQEREPSSKARAELAEVWAWLKLSGVL